MEKRLLSILSVLITTFLLVLTTGVTVSAETGTANPYLTFSADNEFKLGVYDNDPNELCVDGLEYSTDANIWNKFTADGASAVMNSADGKYYVYLRGNDMTSLEDTNLALTSSTSGILVDCTGNVMTLLDYDNPDDVIMTEDAFAYLFYDCDILRAAPVLPATTLAECCYQYMFEGCSSLEKAPELPATELKLYCYGEMFKGCTSLMEAPGLPATTLAIGCYWGMFQESGLTKAPKLSVTELAEECYQSMFYGCESLKEAPDLPATVMKDYCYGDMFNGCTSLKVAPKLPSTTLAESCYASMFANCTSLVYAPDLPATELKPNCYAGMFADCTALTTPPCMATATDLESHGSEPYQYMFKGCSSLVKSITSGEGKAAFFKVPGNLEPDNNHFFNNYCQDMFGDGDNYDKYTIFYVGTVAAPIYEVPEVKTSLVYDGSEQTLLSYTGKTETSACKLQYSLTKDGEYTDTIPVASTAGTYTIWYKAVSNGSPLYFDSEPASISVQILQDSTHKVVDTGVKGKDNTLKLISLFSLLGIATAIATKKKKH